MNLTNGSRTKICQKKSKSNIFGFHNKNVIIYLYNCKKMIINFIDHLFASKMTSYEYEIAFHESFKHSNIYKNY